MEVSSRPKTSKLDNIHNVWKKSYLTKAHQLSGLRKARINALQEVALGVTRVDAPPVVGKDVEDAERDNEEDSGPFGFEADGDHDTGGKPENRSKNACDSPFTLNNEPKEQEDEQNATSEEEAASD